MISKDQIKELLVDIENERVERTISTKDTEKFAKAICAFANDLSNKKLPGYLMVGTHDDGSLNGLKVTDELLRNLAGLRSDGNIQPKPALMVEKVSFPEGDLAVVEVLPSKITPVKYKGTTYVRIGARKSEANEEEDRILREKSEVKSPTFDTTPCLHSTIDDLDLDLFKTEYLPKFVKASVLKNDKRELKQQLASLQLFDLLHDCPTVAGVLLIGKDPKHILFGSYIQYVQFEGKTRTSKVLNERQFSGNLLTMLKELDYFIKYTIQKQRPVFVTVLREEMRINYPYEAMRELAMNLVMHRNYQTNAPAKFYEYSDRIEMDNPGNLYGKVSPENFPNETDYRNPVIAVAMKTLGYVNQFGRGVETVQEELVANKNGLAVFKFEDITTFKAIVMNADEAEKERNSAESDADGAEKSEKSRRSVGEVSEKNVGEKLTERQKAILQHIEQNNVISAKEISALLQIADRTVERDIQKLKEKGFLERIGGDRGGYWEIK
ncbi:ATP-dependent DNA helicase RecG [Parabacteroides sp. PFB2-10]|uniref:RNA-binding domain-containing protein n=1 Tax=Parabacteroides sp. PFB2-10 TaxID=1742405 RepID=UPI0024757B6D|nr:RNA-binding domain-containing protein [Parabacteroides sp. PFB2-10]MDH6313911.1 ATP-dependent DNA helicase RecG [Parabacteroides sp. PFB2-10]